jgi:molybdopterin-synthase adenylyltransferase
MTTIVIPWTLMPALERLFENSPAESAGVLFCREVRGRTQIKLLASEFLAYADGDYLERGADKLVIDPVAVNDRIQRAKRLDLSIVQVHTHPLSENADFSPTDLNGESEMLPVFHRRVPNRHHGSLVLGRNYSSARIYDNDLNASSVRIIAVGKDVQHLDARTAPDEERFSRSYLALGKEGQVALQSTRVCIVGLGGLGAHVAQQLSYLGVEHVVLIDPDVVEASNLNRIVGAVPSDVGRAKVEVAADHYRATLPTAAVHPIAASILDEKIARSVIDCDVALCCTDNHGSRAVLNWLAYQYLVPTIDMGIEIRVDENDAIGAIAGRVQLVGPGMPCLHCCESLDANRVREDFMTEEERAADEYVVGGIVRQPAVVTFNGIVASLATSMLIGLTTDVPIRARMQIVDLLKGQVRLAEASAREDCPVCSSASVILGQGDVMDAIWRKAG